MNRVRGLILVSALLFGQACNVYTRTYVTAVPAASADWTKREVKDSFFWGLLQDDVKVMPSDCPSNAIHTVRHTTNFGYALLTVVTLGIWTRSIIEYKCAKEPAPAPPNFAGKEK